jgi:hypothetical protein
MKADNEAPVEVARIGEHVRVKQGDDEVYISYRRARIIASKIKATTPGTAEETEP